MRAALLGALVAMFLVSCAGTRARLQSQPGSGGTASPPQVPRELPEREELPVQAREMLSTRMQRHGDQMTMLLVSVVLVSYDATELFAKEIAKEPKLARPTSADRWTLNALLPKRFFSFQDELAVRANELAAAASARDEKALVHSFGRLTQACVGCHSAYLTDDIEVLGSDEPRHD